jgi:hypothetical protein
MKIKLKETPEQIELIKAMASSNKLEAMEAQEAFAGFIAPVIQQVLNQAGTASQIYVDLPFDEDDSPSIPLDLYYLSPVNSVQTWSQSMAGGLPSSQVTGLQELKISTYRLDSAVSWNKKYARRSRLDVVSAAMNRLMQEILVKQERNAYAVVLAALGNATTAGTKHTIAATTQNVLQLDDFNRLMTLNKRLNQSFANGTPDNAFSNGITDIFLSPEMKEQIRGFSYNPMNTRNGKVGGGSDTSTSVPLPDAIREAIFNSAGTSEIYGVSVHELNELGTTQKYNVLFGSYAQAGIANAGGNFSTATDEILIGIDLTKEAFRRPVARKAESGATFTTSPDDQFQARSDKMGVYGSLEESRVCQDGRAVVGLVV